MIRKVIMIGLKKRDIKKALKAGAKAGGVSLADVRADIEATIDEAMNSTAPEVQTPVPMAQRILEIFSYPPLFPPQALQFLRVICKTTGNPPTAIFSTLR